MFILYVFIQLHLNTQGAFLQNGWFNKMDTNDRELDGTSVDKSI